MSRSGSGELTLHVLLEVVLLLLGDHAVQHYQEDADQYGEQTNRDELVPPATGGFGAPVREVAGQ